MRGLLATVADDHPISRPRSRSRASAALLRRLLLTGPAQGASARQHHSTLWGQGSNIASALAVGPGLLSSSFIVLSRRGKAYLAGTLPVYGLSLGMTPLVRAVAKKHWRLQRRDHHRLGLFGFALVPRES